MHKYYFILSKCQSTGSWKMEAFAQNLVNPRCYYNHCLLHSGISLSPLFSSLWVGFWIWFFVVNFFLMLLFLSPRLILYLDLSQKFLSLRKSLIKMYLTYLILNWRKYLLKKNNLALIEYLLLCEIYCIKYIAIIRSVHLLFWSACIYL